MTDKDCKAQCRAYAMEECQDLEQQPECFLIEFESCMHKCKSNDGGYCQQSFETDSITDNSLVI